MRVLVTWGSKRGGTAEIARAIGETLEHAGAQVQLLPASKAIKANGFDAVIVGGSLYANRWHPSACRFVRRRRAELRSVPVWFFSSGPLDETSDHDDIAPVREVATLMGSVGAQGHVTFGGRLAPDARGFPASAMAKKRSGDWRNPARIQAWAAHIAETLPSARARPAMEVAGDSPARLVVHGVTGWAACAAIMGLLLAVVPLGVALAVHAVAAPIVFIAVARRYFKAPGARTPLVTAGAFVGIVALLDATVVAGLLQHSVAMFRSVTGTWLPFALIFLSTWATGTIMAMMPWPVRTEALPTPA